MSLKTKDKHALLKSYSQPDERLLLAKVLDQADLSLKKHIICFTDFIAPAMLAEIEELLRKYDGLKTKQFGGYDDAERKMIAVFPEYIDEEDIYFPLGAVGISYNKKFTSSISHRDYLGSIMGLGIERGKVGDIVAMDGEAICFAEQSIADYILSNLERVGHTKVKTQKADINQLRLPEKKMEIKNITVSSFWRSIRKFEKRNAGFDTRRESFRKLDCGKKLIRYYKRGRHTFFKRRRKRKID